MTEVRKRIDERTAHLGTLLEEQGVVLVLGAAKVTVEDEHADPGELFPYDAYQDRAAAFRDGWVPV